jgi:hypothetical protein
MAGQEQHHHHHQHSKDGSTIYKERTLRNIALRKKIENILKIAMIALAAIMGLAVVAAYTIG